MSIFSEREEKVIKIIGRKKLTLKDISEELFKKGDKPFDNMISVSNSVRRIAQKCFYRKLDWTLERTREDKTLTVKKVYGKVHKALPHTFDVN